LNPYEVWFALFAFFGVVVVAPAWMYFVQALLPITALLLAASWLQPGES
jgi:hypothetical protein